MKALTVRQPWAWAIACAGKTVENRSWPTDYRGLLAIHAGKKPEPIDPYGSSQEAELHKHIRDVEWSSASEKAFCARGAIVAVVDLVGEHVCDGSCSPWAVPGAHHFELDNPRVLATPLIAVGVLGLWNPGNLLESLIAEQVAL